MEKYQKITGLFLALVFLFSLPVLAQPGEKEEAGYVSGLSLNQMPLPEFSRKLTLYKEMLPGGELTLRGRIAGGANGRNIWVSLDGKDTWRPAERTGDGFFAFHFRPDYGRDYYIYIGAGDGNGGVEPLAQGGFQLYVSGETLSGAVRHTIDEMMEEYRERDAAGFMKYVSSRFRGEDILLHRAVRRDFSLFDVESLRYSIDNFSFDTQGRVVVTLRFQRSVTSFTNPFLLRDTGTTELAFLPGADKLELYAMKAPLLFGLSDAKNLVSGIVATGENAASQFVTANSAGAIVLGTLAEAAGQW